MSSNISGLASSIRGATESETFDLAGQNQNTITTAINAAFSTPFPIQEMIRLTFITGAGKLGRQKYDDNAPRALTSALRSLGFEDDRAASCVPECAGLFKSQHDTGKNLKTIVVFPRITVAENEEEDALQSSMGKMNLGSSSASKLPSGSPENMCALSSMQVFTKMLSAKCPSWSQKKGCLGAINLVVALVQGMEEQLGRGQPLSDADQDLYDSISSDILSQKEALVKKEMQQHVETGKLTKAEKELLLNQVTERISKLEAEVSTLTKAKKPKKLEKVTAMLDKAKARKNKLEDITPQSPYRLKHEAEIIKLRVEMVPLLKLENGAKGRLLTMKETKTLARKDEILSEIEELERKSREWFESDEVFQTRVQLSRTSSSTAAKQKAVKKKPAAKGTGNIVYKKNLSGWVTPGMKKMNKAPVKPKKKLSAGGVFAAMMMDSDSDSD